MIKLYNHTGLPDKPLRDVLTWAATRIGVAGGVYVKLTPNRTTREGYRGCAHRGWPYLGYLRNDKARCQLGGGPRGWIEIATGLKQTTQLRGRPKHLHEDLKFGEDFLHTALHEMSHIRDFRSGDSSDDPRTSSGRRINHDQRPCEIRAENRVYDARQGASARKRSQDLILNLALAVEAHFLTHLIPIVESALAKARGE